MEYKLPPNDQLAEKAVLGSMLFDSNAVLEAVEKLKPEDFYHMHHAKIFEAMRNLSLSMQAIDFITVRNELATMGMIENIGGSEYLTELADSVPTSANIKQYIEIVKEKSQLRKLISAASEMQKLGFDEEQEAKNIIAKAQEVIFDLNQENVKNGYEVLKEILISTYKEIDEAYNNKGKLTGVSTGFVEFDKKTNGLQKKNLVILAARPGMGKSALAVNMATHIAINEKKPVLIFNMEMSKNEIAKRILSSETMIDNNKIKTGNIYGEDRNKMVQALSVLSKAELYIDDTAGINIMEIAAKARKLKADKGLAMIVIDYLQLIEPISKKNQTREQEITVISRSLKQLAMELDIPIIALSQLSRSAERKNGKEESKSVKRPMLSDLRESGAIEQDADLVLFIYRDDYYNETSERKNIAELIIAKHRGGRTGTIPLFWSGEHTKFMNLEQDEDIDWGDNE